MNIIEEFHTRRNHGNSLVMAEEFLPYKRFYALDTQAYSAGEIPEKYKELIGLSSSMVLRCNDCIVYHLERCFQAGCTKTEINEAMNIALVIGGSIVIPHLRHALAALEELESKSSFIKE